jgi:iron complex transport system permease protein
MSSSVKKTIVTSTVLFALLLTIFFISLNTGRISIPPDRVIMTLLGAGTNQEQLVLFNFRLPRMVIALLIGAAIAVSGAILQSVSNNGLADPGILGINAGAGLAIVLFIFFAGGTASLGTLGVLIMPFFALIGAFMAALIIYFLAWKGGVTPLRLILIGIGVNAAFGAALIVFQLKMDPRDFMRATVWLTGSIWGTSWTHVVAVLPWALLLIPFAWLKSQYLNILTLGDQLATGLGARVEHERRILLLTAVALAGAAVSVGGGIAFLGLVAPHLARRLIGPRHESLIPVSALMGALLLLLSDFLSRVVLSPAELPVGIIISALGAPYFLYLLIKTP